MASGLPVSMSCQHHPVQVQTQGRGFTRIDPLLQSWLDTLKISDGLANIFVHHTSCSLLITENADPDVRYDLETLMSPIAPDGDPRYRHNSEGDDDMSAHFRSVLTQTSVTLPVQNSRLLLGTWQGLFLWEHRTRTLNRKLTFSFLD